MQISQASQLYDSIAKISAEDENFRRELKTLFEGAKGASVSGPESQKIVDFLTADGRVPFDKETDPEIAWITVPITISIALCPWPAY